MADRNNFNNIMNPTSGSGPAGVRETVCIDTYRVLDSCRDKDCFENTRVYLTSYGQEIIERTSNIRVKCANVIWCYIDIDAVPFNRGFYQLDIRIYVKVICEACICPGNIQEFEGIAVLDKKVILFGSEGNVSVFKSEPGTSGFCPRPGFRNNNNSSNLPVAVIETVDPVVLNAKVVEPNCCPCYCCCTVDEIPEDICAFLNGDLYDRDPENSNKLVASFGLFSVIRIERPAQYLINAVEYSVPDKECIEAKDNDPCSLFKNMAFPISEFSPPSISSMNGDVGKHCGC